MYSDSVLEKKNLSGLHVSAYGGHAGIYGLMAIYFKIQALDGTMLTR